MKISKEQIKNIVLTILLLFLGIGIGFFIHANLQPAQVNSSVSSEIVQEESEKQESNKIEPKDPESNMNVPETVYWTPNGKVYHLRESCPSLNHSAVIEHGTIEESGKSRVCRNCETEYRKNIDPIG